MPEDLLYNRFPNLLIINSITYLPHEAAAEVSRDMKPIGEECVIQMA